MPFLEEDTFKVVKNTREEWAEWRASDTPIIDAFHTVFEVLLVYGWMWRFLTHFLFWNAYLEDEDGNTPELTDDDFRFTALVYPVLEPVHWRQEALMRGVTAILGLVLLSTAINPTVKFTTDMAYVQLQFWAAMTQGGYMLFDPLLGVAQRIATR